MGQCVINQCKKPRIANGMCTMHYDRKRRHGDPLWKPMTPSERFWSKVDKNGPIIRPELGPCWISPLARVRGPGGDYGRITVDNKHWYVHRWVWTQIHGPIPDGTLEVCHRCDYPPCCNPQHLFLGTSKDNAQDRVTKHRDWHSRITHCPQGHPYSERNTYLSKTGSRVCRTCQAAYQSRLRQRRRE